MDLIRDRLVYAGLDGRLTAERMAGYKAAAAAFFFLFGLMGSPIALPTPLWALLLGAAGSIAPDMWLDSKGKERQQKIARDLPEALDLLAISVEAGLGLEQAFGVVTENLTGPLGDEFMRLLREIELGVPRRQALNQLRERTDVSELSAFVVALIQADQVGAPIADVLRVQAEQVRLKRRQRAREKAAQTPVKILFPLIFFIFPALFVVTIGPGAIRIMENLLTNL
ncbi:MAG: type II secretion system F family protein [Actinomycetota bacterium]